MIEGVRIELFHTYAQQILTADIGRWDVREHGYPLQCLLVTIGSNFWGHMKVK